MTRVLKKLNILLLAAALTAVGGGHGKIVLLYVSAPQEADLRALCGLLRGGLRLFADGIFRAADRSDRGKIASV